MGIFLRHSYNVKPPRWGSPADVQYAIKINAEKIYDVDLNSIVLAMPLFWGLPPLDYSGYNNHGANHGATYKDGSLDFDGSNDLINIQNKVNFNFLTSSFSNKYTIMVREKSNADRGQFFSKSYQSGDQSFGSDFRIGSNMKITYLWGMLTSGNNYWSWSTDNAVAGDGNWNDCAVVINTSSSCTFYVNGDEKANTKFTGGTGGQEGTNVAPVYIGARDGAVPADQVWLLGNLKFCNVITEALTPDQIALFHALPYGLYQPVSRPIWSIPAAIEYVEDITSQPTISEMNLNRIRWIIASECE